MKIKIEHANLCAKDIDAMIHFLQTAFPEFKIRHDAIGADGNRWVHIGTETIYFALEQATLTPPKPWIPYAGFPGVNHIAFEVENVEEIKTRLTNAGYKNSTIPNNHPHRKRIYFHDAEGNDWEFVQYISDISSERNDYKM